MSRVSALLALFAVSALPHIGTAASVSAPLPDVSSGIFRIQISGRNGTADGTCFLVYQRPTERDVTLYFLTAARLLDPEPLGERRSLSLRIRISIDESRVIETTGREVTFPGGGDQGIDVAVVRASSSLTDVRPVVVSMHPPVAGEMFVVRGYRGDDVAVLPERVRFRSTRLLLGDRTAADVSGIVGAPAMTDAGVFGLISECSTTRVPLIALLSAAERFLLRAIPGWTPVAPS